MKSDWKFKFLCFCLLVHPDKIPATWLLHDRTIRQKLLNPNVRDFILMQILMQVLIWLWNLPLINNLTELQTLKIKACKTPLQGPPFNKHAPIPEVLLITLFTSQIYGERWTFKLKCVAIFLAHSSSEPVSVSTLFYVLLPFSGDVHVLHGHA